MKPRHPANRHVVSRLAALRDGSANTLTRVIGLGETDSLSVPVPTSLSDSQLAYLARDGDNTAFELILHRYHRLVRARARSYFLLGAEYEDLIQEGMIGLFKAVRDFRQNGSAFRTFAELCITRQIITAVKTASRQKHLPLNSALSLDAPRYDGDGGRTIGDAVCDPRAPYDAALLQTAELRAVMAILRRHLSAFEYSALALWLEGNTYEEIGRRFGRHAKSVDNGLWRVKCKIRRLLDAGVIPRGGS